MINPSAVIESSLPKTTTVWRWTHISPRVKLGEDCMIGANVYIGPGVQIGHRVRIQNNCFIPEGTVIGDDVFIGPAVTITNDKYPPSDVISPVIIEDNVVIGGGCTIVAGVLIRSKCKIGAGVTVAQDCSPYLNGEGWIK